ncbi:GH3 auxin-responsive promoter family protein [Pontibacter sp. BT310]|uniref:GH3 auxin-responsive promoter family protein n=1 Tax=Pontibacter populi TaxID=890055 RepID=A0ABS6XA91_9BACT|nr:MULTISPECIES: GH3 auxin-responsive promoter family protein [Pontibacter]MBJ6117575.1 GH3 auxin-responsive promoter family protein [Pontibacter sp. BT310]MBR0570000.1 GH3 auxin-responsive promoter family protein [Microvirga sp. STS03]MBW3364428.1 GH3 auxin-responsive promoter family protein [Pontibacter populi]
MKKRIHDIDLFRKYPHEVQNELFQNLISTAKGTEWGKKYGYSDGLSVREFQERVPVTAYEELYPYIERVMMGEQNLLWPSKIEWFAKSSGTTNARSKFIPVSPESLEDCHYKGGKDMLSIYVNLYPETKLFTGKGLSIGGSHRPSELNAKVSCGDVSAVIMQNLPIWAEAMRTPPLKVALMDKWEEKIEKMVELTVQENVTSMSGVPTWTYVLLKRILEVTGKNNILEVWPNLELFTHGAVAFGPYRQLFKEIIPSDKMNYLEVYNASEGFFGIQDQAGTEDEMLLMLDYGVYYEFIPMDQFEEEIPKTLTLDQVELNKNYAIVISTNAGLWRYKIGDTIRFTSLSPYRIKISGRTKHFINAFGEEVIVENAEAAITRACEATGAIITNFTAAPIFMESGKRGGHEWLIEFEKQPDNLKQFTYLLDETLREVNSDYDAKRQNDIALQGPIVHAAPQGTFMNWLREKGKLGGQNKVPRLSNSREYLEEIMQVNGL